MTEKNILIQEIRNIKNLNDYLYPQLSIWQKFKLKFLFLSNIRKNYIKKKEENIIIKQSNELKTKIKWEPIIESKQKFIISYLKLWMWGLIIICLIFILFKFKMI